MTVDGWMARKRTSSWHGPRDIMSDTNRETFKSFRQTMTPFTLPSSRRRGSSPVLSSSEAEAEVSMMMLRYMCRELNGQSLSRHRYGQSPSNPPLYYYDSAFNLDFRLLMLFLLLLLLPTTIQFTLPFVP